jgi:hypothetical protein
MESSNSSVQAGRVCVAGAWAKFGDEHSSPNVQVEMDSDL